MQVQQFTTNHQSFSKSPNPDAGVRSIVSFNFFEFSLPKIAIFKTNRWSDFKGAVLGRRQFLVTESPLKMMKNASYFTLKFNFRFHHI